MVREPAKNPCGSCPYRRDVASGIWDASEYARLPAYDLPTGEQPMKAFLCHQQNGRLCGGWAATHDMANNIGLRLLASFGHITQEALDKTFSYTTKVPLFTTGAEAAIHGLRDVAEPSAQALKQQVKIIRRRRAQRGHRV